MSSWLAGPRAWWNFHESATLIAEPTIFETSLVFTSPQAVCFGLGIGARLASAASVSAAANAKTTTPSLGPFTDWRLT